MGLMGVVVLWNLVVTLCLFLAKSGGVGVWGFKSAEGWNSDPYSSCVPVDTNCSVVVRSKLWSLSN